MNENENDFEALRRLLALKRHETPPPGYFESFPRGVMARLRASQSGAQDSVAERMAERLPWLFRMVQALENKPAFATSFASALCVLLLAGIIFAEQPEVTVQPLMQSAQEPTSLSIAAAAPSGFPAEPVDLQARFISSTTPVLNPQPMSSQSAIALFGGQNGFAQPVSLILPGN